MKERGIIFQGWGVRAILDNLKSLTRRLKGLEKINKTPDEWEQAVQLNDGSWSFWGPHGVDKEWVRNKAYPNGGGFKCPYGVVGDRLWVRETFAKYQTINHTRRMDGRSFAEISDGFAAYRADGHETIVDLKDHIRLMSGADLEAIEVENDKWKPSIFMPRWASRIDLEITGVRVERLQEITEEDAIAEGSQIPCAQLPKSCQQATMTERTQFSRIWDSINKKHPWELNPWVWVIEFKRISMT